MSYVYIYLPLLILLVVFTLAFWVVVVLYLAHWWLHRIPRLRTEQIAKMKAQLQAQHNGETPASTVIVGPDGRPL